MQPGQGYFYSVTSSNAVVKKVDIDDYILWKDGLYQFHNQPFMEIARRVEKYYNISILIGNNQINNTIVSGKLVLTDESENVINYLAKTLEVKYERKDGSTFLLK